MKKHIFLIISFIFTQFIAFSQEKRAFSIYTAKGEPISYTEMISELKNAKVILFGELHNNPISHWLELQITKSLYQKNKNLTLGAEMFEADNQLLVNEYINGIIRDKDFDNQARLWPNYKTDYKPLIKFAREKHLHFIATNIPRRYAAIVAREGFKGLNQLSQQAKTYIAPLPIKYDSTLQCYKAIAEGMPAMAHTGENIAKAQAIKDATMAYFIYKNLPKNGIFIHYNGAYHSDNYQGIFWYLKQKNKNLSIKTISSVEQNNINKLNNENKNIADFIIAIPSDMTKTY